MSGWPRHILADNFMQQSCVGFGWSGEIPTPLPPRSGIISHSMVAQQFKDKIQPAGSNTTRAITDDFLSFMQPALLETFLDRRKVLEGCIGVEKTVPRHVDR